MSRKKSIKTHPKSGAIYRYEKRKEREVALEVAKKNRRNEQLIRIPNEMPVTLFSKRGDESDDETIARYWRKRQRLL